MPMNELILCKKSSFEEFFINKSKTMNYLQEFILLKIKLITTIQNINNMNKNIHLLMNSPRAV